MTHRSEQVEPPLNSRGVQILVAVLALLALILTICWVPEDRDQPDALSVESITIDLNVATERELSLLPGIGPVLARRILEDRNRLGPFVSPRELGRVHGVGPKKLRQLLPYICTDAPAPSASSNRGPATSIAASAADAAAEASFDQSSR